MLREERHLIQRDEVFKVITFHQKGNFTKTMSFFEKLLNLLKLGELDRYGRMGVEALAAATPKDTGKTAESWGYKIVRSNGSASISWYNTNTNDGVNIALIIQYGHGTRGGTFVQGRDYINPAIRSVFDNIEQSVRRELR